MGSIVNDMPGSGGGAAGVTSVSFTGDGAIFTGSAGTAVTSTGTLTPQLIAQAKNTMLLGPTTGSNAAPAFRALVLADLPFTGTPTGSLFACGDGTWKASGGSGTVTSVTFTGDGVLFTGSAGSAVTTTGTLTPSLINQAKNTMLLGPSTGANAAPTFRALVPADFPFPVISTAKTANYSILLTDSVVKADNTAGAFTLTMPAPASCKGQTFVLVNVGSGTNLITIAANVSETFGQAALTALHMSTASESWTLMSDGTNWLILGHYATTAPATYTLTLGSTGATPPTKGTVVVDKVLWWREGKNLRMQYTYQQSAGGTQGTTGSVIKYPLPAGYSADTSLHPVSTTNFQFIGNAYGFYPSVITGSIAASLATATDVCLWTGNTIVTTNNLTYNSAGTFVLGFDVTIPIANWEP